MTVSLKQITGVLILIILQSHNIHSLFCVYCVQLLYCINVIFTLCIFCFQRGLRATYLQL